MEPVTAGREFELPHEAPVRGFIEVLDRAGHVAQRIPVTRLPLFIGRAYNNDVILDDPYVSPIHLRLELNEAGRLVAEDLNSANGLHREREKRRVAQVELEPGAEARIGHTRLRYRDRDFPVTRTLADFSASSPLLLLEKPWIQVALYVFTLGWLLLGNYLRSVENPKLLKVLAELVPVIVSILVWAGGWAFASRLLVHRLNFFIHCAIACSSVVLFTAYTVGLSYLVFAFNGDVAEDTLQLIGNALLMAAILYAHLRFCSPALPRRLGVTAIVLAGTAYGLLLLQTQVNTSGFSAAPRYNTTLKPLAFQWIPSEPAADFFTQANKLRDQVQEAAKKK